MKCKRIWLLVMMVFLMLEDTGIFVSADVTQQPLIHNQIKRNVKEYQFGNTIYEIKKPKARHKLTNQQIDKYSKQIRLQTWYDIKEERAENLAPAIHINHKLNRLASIRAEQISYRFSHYSKNSRTPMTRLDAKRVGLPKSFQGSENIASESLGSCTMFDDPKIYHNHNGKDMADMSNDGMMNYDSFENNGHRKNILGSSNKLIGIGVAYNPSKKTFYLAEDFGNSNPQSSEDVKKPRLFHSNIHLNPNFNNIWCKSVHCIFNFWHRAIHWVSDHFYRHRGYKITLHS